MRFVKPDVVRLKVAFSDGSSGWIDVKKDLTVGEEKRFRTAGFGQMSPTGDGVNTIKVDWVALALARVNAYLVDWSEKQPVKPAVIENLDQADFDVIDAAIQAHIEQREQEKKATSGAQTLALP